MLRRRKRTYLCHFLVNSLDGEGGVFEIAEELSPVIEAVRKIGIAGSLHTAQDLHIAQLDVGATTRILDNSRRDLQFLVHPVWCCENWRARSERKTCPKTGRIGRQCQRTPRFSAILRNLSLSKGSISIEYGGLRNRGL